MKQISIIYRPANLYELSSVASELLTIHLLKMPLGTVFSLLKTAADIIIIIINRLNQMKMSENLVSRIIENVKYLQSTIKIIEPHLKKDSDTEEILHFLGHLENASKSCSAISEKHKVMKFAKAPGYIFKLHDIEAEIKMANSKLLLFMAANNLTMHCESADFQNKKIKQIFALQQNSMAGLNIVEDKSIRRPPAPPGFNIQHCNSNSLGNQVEELWISTRSAMMNTTTTAAFL